MAYDTQQQEQSPGFDVTMVQGKDKAFLQFLISRHLDGINYLIRQKRSGTKDEATLFSVINSSLKAFEAMMLPIVSEDYEKLALPLKEKCDKYDKLLRAESMDWVDCFNPLMDWYTMLIKELSRIGMLPVQEVEVEVESYDWGQERADAESERRRAGVEPEQTEAENKIDASNNAEAH